MKKVFSNSQLCHVWAQQKQSEGRNANGSLYFRDSMIFSYGSHYMAGKIHTFKGKRFALVNSHRYSQTTSMHLCDIRNALSGLMPSFECADVSNVKSAVTELDNEAQEAIRRVLRVMKVPSKASIKYEFEYIHNAFKTSNELRKILGKSERWPTKKQLDTVQKHLEKRLARYHELNTPEMVAKREVERVKRADRAERKEREKLAEQIARFREGNHANGLYNLRHELLRIQGDTVKTSRGAEVPLAEAQLLYRAIKAGKDVLGKTVGNFTVVRVIKLDADTEIKIGCHTILLSEADAVLGATRPGLTLVSSANAENNEVA